MPKAYESIKKKSLAKGMEEDEAQTHAAKIYNYQKGKGTKGFGAKLPNKPESVQKRFEKDWVKKGRKPF